MRTIALVLLLSAPLCAQDVRPVPDALSWGTAAVNPTVGLVRAFQSEDRACHLKRLAVSGGIASTGILLQRVIDSPRPCCAGNGMPSLHAAFGSVGSSWSWGFGASFAVGTGGLRVAANRHTRGQAWAGVLLGMGGELASQLIRCEP